MPSAIMETPSLMNVPITREVKKPRLSLTTIGVLRIPPSVTSNALATVASDVCSPLMISTSGILSTGEKKCSPMKSPWRSSPRGELGDRQRGGVRAEQRVGLDHLHRLAEDLLLERDRLEDGLDDDVAAREVVVVVGRG